jgi:ABC-type nitrate/sulfonate/bicarbonate transport system permease component
MNARKTRRLVATVMGATPLRVLIPRDLAGNRYRKLLVGLHNGALLTLIIVVVAEMIVRSTDGVGDRIFETRALSPD